MTRGRVGSPQKKPYSVTASCMYYSVACTFSLLLPSSCNSLQRVRQMMTTTINCNAIPDQSVFIAFVFFLNVTLARLAW